MHMIDFSNNRANMAFIGEKPWHGLGQELEEGASIDEWRVAAGMDWTALRSGVQFQGSDGQIHQGEHDVLYRSDTFGQLGIVSPAYKIVQPAEVMEFFRDIVDGNNMKMETAGSLDGGRKVWALAKTGQDFRLMGQDKVDAYLMLATSFDGTLATKAMFTSVRVVCNNTLQMSLRNNSSSVAISHSTSFDASKVRFDLGIMGAGFAEFEEKANILAQRKVSQGEAVKYLLSVLAPNEELEKLSTRKGNIIKGVYDLFNGKGMGSDYKAADGTAWGLVNAITQYVDHEQGNNVNNRFRSAQFGVGADLKQLAFKSALALVA